MFHHHVLNYKPTNLKVEVLNEFTILQTQQLLLFIEKRIYEMLAVEELQVFHALA